MAVTKAPYRKFYGLATEKDTPPEGWTYKNMDFYFSTDTHKFFVYYIDTWYEI